MTILQIIQRLLGLGGAEAPDVQAELERIRAAAPDTAPQVDRILEVLGRSVEPGNLLTVGPELVGALWDLSHGHFKPVKGAGDGI